MIEKMTRCRGVLLCFPFLEKETSQRTNKQTRQEATKNAEWISAELMASLAFSASIVYVSVQMGKIIVFSPSGAASQRP